MDLTKFYKNIALQLKKEDMLFSLDLNAIEQFAQALALQIFQERKDAIKAFYNAMIIKQNHSEVTLKKSKSNQETIIVSLKGIDFVFQTDYLLFYYKGEILLSFVSYEVDNDSESFIFFANKAMSNVDAYHLIKSLAYFVTVLTDNNGNRK